MLGTTLQHRYRLEQVLHRADSGPLYLATDERTGEMLALKCFSAATDLSTYEGHRYRRGVERLVGLEHPRVLAPRFTGAADGVAFQVLPYFPGDSLGSLLATGPLGISDAVDLLRQCAQGLVALHAAGVHHGNLKPANILVSRGEDGLDVVLTDPLRQLLRPPELYGSDSELALYLAPEQVPWQDGRPDRRTDLYALGAIVYAALTGAPPFTGGTALEILHRHQTASPPELAALLPEIPARLAAILAKLLAKAPSDRYQTAAGLLADLKDWKTARAAPLGLEERRDPLAPGLYLRGREQAREVLLSALSRAQSGEGTLLWMSGPPGSGRRSLVRSVSLQLETSRGLVLRAPARPQEWCPPWYLPIALLNALVGHWAYLPDARRRDLLQRLNRAVGAHAGVLTGIVPALQVLMPEEIEPAPLPLARERFRTLHVLTEALLALADVRYPLVLVLEAPADADADSQEWLTWLARRVASAPVLVLAGCTPNAASGAPLLSDLLTPATSRRDVQRIELPPLSTAHTAAWLAEALSRSGAADSPDMTLPARLAQWLVTRWGGRPLEQQLVLELLLAKGVLRAEGHAADWRCDWEALENGPWPESLPALLQHRLELIPDEWLPVFQALSCAVGGCSFEQLAAMLEHIPRSLLVASLEGAISEGLIVGGRHGLDFPHDALREAVSRTLPPNERESFHQALGALIDEEEWRAPLLRLHAAAQHARHGGDDVRFADAGCRLIAEANRTQALRSVVDWSGHLQPLLHADRRLADLLITTGIAHAQLERPDLAVALLETARSVGLPEVVELDAFAYAAWAEIQRNNEPAALALVEEGLSRAGETLPSNPVEATLSRLGGATARRYEAIRNAAGGETLPPLDERERRILELLGLASRLLAMDQPARAALADERILRLAGGRAPSPQLVAALVRLGEADGVPNASPFGHARSILDQYPFPHAAAAWSTAVGLSRLEHGEWDAARDLLQQGLAGYQALGSLPDIVPALLGLIELERQQGPLKRLAQAVAALRDLSTQMRTPLTEALCHGLTTYVGWLAGRATHGKTGDALRAGAERSAGRRELISARYLLALAAEVALASGDMTALIDTGRVALPLLEGRSPIVPALLPAALAEGHLMLALRSPDESAHHLKQAAALVHHLGHSEGKKGLRPDLVRVQVLDAIQAGDPDEALRLADSALERLDAVRGRQAAAWLRFRVAEGLKEAGRDEWLHWGGAALTSFDDLGQVPYAEATRRLLELSEASDAQALPDLATAAVRKQQTSTYEALQPLLERIAQDGALDHAELQALLLDAFVRAGDAEYGAWFAPHQDGTLVPHRFAPDSGAGAERFNRWLAESVYREGRGDVLEHYQVPPEEQRETGRPEAQSLICVPVGTGPKPAAVVMLGSAVSHQIHNRTQLPVLTALGRQAGIAVDMNARLLGADEANRELRLEQVRHGARLRWAEHATQSESLSALLSTFGEDVAAHAKCSGAVLCVLDQNILRLAGTWGAVPQAGALSAEFPLELATGQAEAALNRHVPVSGAALDVPMPNAAEDALLNALNANALIWLPLILRGTPFGVLALVAERGAPSDSVALETQLMEPLRLIAGAVHDALRMENVGAALQERDARIRALESDAAWLRRFLPAGMPAVAADPERVVSKGREQVVPVLAGEVPGLTRPLGLPLDDLMGTLRRYFAQVSEGLTLHEGRLERIQQRQWYATYTAAVDSALWGVQTVHQMLLELRDEATGDGIPLPPTGLGLHLGSVLWGAVPAGDALAPLLTGAGLRTAARLAAMSIRLRCGVLVSEDTVAALADRRRFDLRPLGKLRPGPGERRLDVYELFSVREPRVVEPMRTLQGVWEEALRDYQRGQWHHAASAFGHYARRLPQDRPARFFLRQSRQRAAQ